MYEYQARIVSIYDGDTLRMDVDLGFGIWTANQALRLNRINAPELRKSELAGLESKKFLQSLLPKDTLVIIKTNKDKEEKYGRMLADVFLEDERCVNDLMVVNKFALYWDGSGERPV